MHQIPNQKIKQAYFLFFVTLMGALLFYWMKDFISSFLGALTMYILLRKPMLFLQEQKRWNKTLVVVLLMLASILLVILPVGLTTMMLSSKVGYLVEHYKEFLTILQQYSAEISQRFGIDILSNDTIQKLTETGARIIPTILSGALNSVTQVAVLYFVLYFMLMEGKVMEKIVMENSPFHNDNTVLLAKELNTQTVSTAVGIPVLATLQAIFACVGYLIFGMDQVLFWAVITGLFSILPLVGTLIIWVPLSVYLYFNGLHWQGIGLFLYGAFVITNVDNVFRFMVQKKLGDTHPLITFFGVIVGLDLFGFIGIILGPLLISYFLILLEIYKKEYATLLLVEDDPVLALTLATTLRYLGYRVHVAEDLPTALAHCTCPPGQVGVTDQGRVALALLSTAAPEARELARRLREQLPDLRVLWLTRGLATTGPGGDAWVVPCSFEALALRVRQALS